MASFERYTMPIETTPEYPQWESYLPWAKRVVDDLPEQDVRKLVKWWQGKTAKNIWGTSRARKQRQALKEAIKQKYGN